jgi:hypothetical protein
VPLWHEAVASRDALRYIDATGSPEDQEEAYRLLYPAYGTYVGGAVGDILPGAKIIPYAGAVVAGHIAGRIQGRRIAGETRLAEVQQLTDEFSHRSPGEPGETITAGAIAPPQNETAN